MGISISTFQVIGSCGIYSWLRGRRSDLYCGNLWGVRTFVRINEIYDAVYLQFGGGLDSKTLCCFEEIKQHVAGHSRRSQELVAGIPSS